MIVFDNFSMIVSMLIDSVFLFIVVISFLFFKLNFFFRKELKRIILMSRDITSSMNKLILRIHWIENSLDRKTKEYIERNTEFKNESIETYQKELNELKVEHNTF